MYTCFIISPIGESGSEIRKNADVVRDLIIKPTLASFGFNVIRGDNVSDPEKIDNKVIRQVQEADLCIIDLSLDNPNVYYEFGHREEAGKPFILLKAKGSAPLPVDVATQSYIEYDLTDISSLPVTLEKLKEAVEPFIEKGFESSGNGTTIQGLADILRRLENKVEKIDRKIERVNKSSENSKAVSPVSINNDIDPFELLEYSILKGDISNAERAMDTLFYRLELPVWLLDVVRKVAKLGSRKAGDILVEKAVELFDNSTIEFEYKEMYLSALLTHLIRRGKILENVGLINKLHESLIAVSPNEPKNNLAELCYQMARMYYGAYVEAKSGSDKEWLEKAINEVEKGLKFDDDHVGLHYQHAFCLRARNVADDMKIALDEILRFMEFDGQANDPDALELACKIMHDLDDDRLEKYFDLLKKVNPMKAELLKNRLTK